MARVSISKSTPMKTVWRSVYNSKTKKYEDKKVKKIDWSKVKTYKINKKTGKKVKYIPKKTTKQKTKK